MEVEHVARMTSRAMAFAATANMLWQMTHFSLTLRKMKLIFSYAGLPRVTYNSEQVAN